MFIPDPWVVRYIGNELLFSSSSPPLLLALPLPLPFTGALLLLLFSYLPCPWSLTSDASILFPRPE